MLLPRPFGPDSPGLRRLEMGLAASVLVMLSNALIGPLFDPDQTGGDAIGWLRLVWLPVYGAVLALALWRSPGLIRFWRPVTLLAILVGWAALSALWSTEPDTTARRALALALTTLFGLYLAARFDGRALAELLASVFVALATVSLAVCLFLPGFGVHQDDNLGDWKGLWYEKNQMGALMAVGTLSALVAASLTPGRRWFWLGAAVICAGMALMSRSATTVIMLTLILAGFGLFNIARRGPIVGLAAAWLGLTSVGLAAAAAVLRPEWLLRALGKDPTITGRTDIWRAVEHWSAQAPWLGYGFAGFWTRSSAPANDIRASLGWLVPSAHNGWLDLRLQLGWIGVMLCGAVFAVAAGGALLRGPRLRDGGWAAILLGIFLLSSLSESVILEPNTLSWALCVAAVVRLLGPSPLADRSGAPVAAAASRWGRRWRPLGGPDQPRAALPGA